MSIEKPLALGIVKTIQLENGPIQPPLSIVLLNGPDPRGPAEQLVDLIRAYKTGTLRAASANARSQDLNNLVGLTNANDSEQKETVS